MSINVSVNTAICSYMNTASARDKEKSAHARKFPRLSAKAKPSSDRKNGEKKR